MLGLYKFCVGRFGMLFGHAVFIFIFGYIAGIVLLFMFGGTEFVSYSPMVVWKNLIRQWSYWSTNKEKLELVFWFKLFAALMAPLVFGFCLKIIIKIVSWPFKKIKQRQDAKKPKILTTEERLKNIESKLDALKEGSTKNTSQESAPQAEVDSQPPQNDEVPQAAETTVLPEHEAHVAGDDEVMITPPPERTDKQPNEESSSHHPDSVGIDFLSRKPDLKKDE